MMADGARAITTTTTTTTTTTNIIADIETGTTIFDCPICFDKMSGRMIQCINGHTYCESCLDSVCGKSSGYFPCRKFYKYTITLNIIYFTNFIYIYQLSNLPSIMFKTTSYP